MKTLLAALAAAMVITGCDEGTSKSSRGNMGPSQERKAPQALDDPNTPATPTPPSATPGRTDAERQP